MQLIRILLVSILFLSINSTYADNRYKLSNKYEPYLGIEYKNHFLEGKGDWERVLPKEYNSGKLFIGAKFTKYFGIELGYTSAIRKTQNASLASGEIFLGDVVPDLVTLNTTTKVKPVSWDLDLNGYFPIQDNFDLIATLGLALNKIDINSDLTVQVIGTDIDDAVINAKAKPTIIPRLGLGSENKFGNFRIRARILWENTGKIRLKDAGLDENDPRDAFKDSFGFSLSLIYNLGSCLK